MVKELGRRATDIDHQTPERPPTWSSNYQ